MGYTCKMNALEKFHKYLLDGDIISINKLPPDFLQQVKLVMFSLENKKGRHDEDFSSLTHLFCDNMYIREIRMKAGSTILTRKHKTEHPFTISKGVVTVFSPEIGLQVLKAPYTGITKPGTQRLLFVNEDTVWTTYHNNFEGETNPDQIVLNVTEPEEIEYEPLKQLEGVRL